MEIQWFNAKCLHNHCKHLEGMKGLHQGVQKMGRVAYWSIYQVEWMLYKVIILPFEQLWKKENQESCILLTLPTVCHGSTCMCMCVCSRIVCVCSCAFKARDLQWTSAGESSPSHNIALTSPHDSLSSCLQITKPLFAYIDVLCACVRASVCVCLCVCATWTTLSGIEIFQYPAIYLGFGPFLSTSPFSAFL